VLPVQLGDLLGHKGLNMKNCTGCKHAEWDKTKSDKLHPSGNGNCRYTYKIPGLPQAFYFMDSPLVLGGRINRKKEFENHCIYYAA